MSIITTGVIFPLDAAGETVIGEKPMLDGAKGVLLTGDELYNAVAGSAIKIQSNGMTLKGR